MKKLSSDIEKLLNKEPHKHSSTLGGYMTKAEESQRMMLKL